MITTCYNENGINVSFDGRQLVSEKIYFAKHSIRDNRIYPYKALKIGKKYTMWRTDGEVECTSPTLLIFMDEDHATF